MGHLISDIQPAPAKRLPLAASYETEPTPSGTKYILPYRDLSQVATFGWLIAIMGSLGLVFMASWIWAPAAEGLVMLRNGNLFGAAILLFASLGLVGLHFVAKMLAAGVTIIRNRSRCEVDIRGTRLYSNETLGWYRWRRKINFQKIQYFELQPAKIVRQDRTGQSSAFPFLEKLYAINAIGKDSTFIIAPGYEKNILESLANDLSRQLAKDLSMTAITRANGNSPAQGAEPNVFSGRERSFSMAVVDKTIVEEIENTSKPEKPADSRIQKADVGQSTAFEVPPQGFSKGTSGLFGFSILWLTFVGLFAVAGLFGGQGPPQGEGWIITLVLGLFALVGIGMLLASINMARRSVMIGIADNQLFIERKTLFGTTWIETPLAEIMDIRIGPSGTEVNDQAVMELQIFTYDGKKHGLLSQLSDEEILWLASELSSELNGGETQRRAIEFDATRDPNWPNPPAGCDTRLESMTRTEKRIVVPPLGFSKGWVGTLVGSVIIAGAVGAFVLVKPDLGTTGFVLFFALIGALILVASVVYCFRRYEFHVTRDQLTVTRAGILGRKTFQWPAREISRIEMTALGQSNGKPMMQLTVFGGNGTLLNSMYSRQPREILYVAAHLNQLLAVDQRQSEGG